MESDSLQCVKLLSSHPDETHHYFAAIKEAQALINRSGWELKILHVSRNMNKVADYLAKKGLELPIGIHEVAYTSPELSVLINLDRNGGSPPIRM